MLGDEEWEWTSILSPLAREIACGNLEAAMFIQRQAKNTVSLVLDEPHEIANVIVFDIYKCNYIGFNNYMQGQDLTSSEKVPGQGPDAGKKPRALQGRTS